MLKSQPRNGTAQTLRDLQRHMNHPCTHTSTACASSLGDAAAPSPAELETGLGEISSQLSQPKPN